MINESSVYSANATLNGMFELADKEFDWSVGYQKGISTITSQRQSVDIAKWLNAMDVGINPETGAIDCRYNYDPDFDGGFVPSGSGVSAFENVLGPVGDCAALNPFGDITDEAAAYVLYNNQGQSRVEQTIMFAYLSGEVVDLPAGPLAFAAGVERRTEYA